LLRAWAILAYHTVQRCIGSGFRIHAKRRRTMNISRATLEAMRRRLLTRVGVIFLVLLVKRGWRAGKLYLKKLSAGTKPTQAIRTAVAAHVGIARLPR
jgi:hypothetical protein